MKSWAFVEKGGFGPDRIKSFQVSANIGDKIILPGGKEGVIFHILQSKTSIGVTLQVHVRGEGLIEFPL